MKINYFFSKFIIFIIVYIPLSSWAYSRCYSPVQLLALMSPNKKSLNSEEKIKKQIKALEKRMEDYEEKLDDVESDLGDSLDEAKLKDNPYSVAFEIRSYIENQQDGWPCAEKPTKRIIEKISLSDLIFPSAYAKDAASAGAALVIRPEHQPPAHMISCSDSQIRDSNGNCREKTDKEKCEDQGKTLTDKNECLTQNERGTYEFLHHKNR